MCVELLKSALAAAPRAGPLQTDGWRRRGRGPHGPLGGGAEGGGRRSALQAANWWWPLRPAGRRQGPVRYGKDLSVVSQQLAT